jgi:hypothetical protein
MAAVKSVSRIAMVSSETPTQSAEGTIHSHRGIVSRGIRGRVMIVCEHNDDCRDRIAVLPRGEGGAFELRFHRETRVDSAAIFEDHRRDIPIGSVRQLTNGRLLVEAQRVDWTGRSPAEFRQEVFPDWASALQWAYGQVDHAHLPGRFGRAVRITASLAASLD